MTADNLRLAGEVIQAAQAKVIEESIILRARHAASTVLPQPTLVAPEACDVKELDPWVRWATEDPKSGFQDFGQTALEQLRAGNGRPPSPRL